MILMPEDAIKQPMNNARRKPNSLSMPFSIV